MPSLANTTKKRITKSERLISVAMSELLSKRNFSRITVSDICGEALISRATFYAYYTDKYDLLAQWLQDMGYSIMEGNDTHEMLEQAVNQTMHENKKRLTNILTYADTETLGVLNEVLRHTMDMYDGKVAHDENDPEYVALSSFYIGGIAQYLIWQVKNGFPQDVPPMNKHLREMIRRVRNENVQTGE